MNEDSFYETEVVSEGQPWERLSGQGKPLTNESNTTFRVKRYGRTHCTKPCSDGNPRKQVASEVHQIFGGENPLYHSHAFRLEGFE